MKIQLLLAATAIGAGALFVGHLSAGSPRGASPKGGVAGTAVGPDVIVGDITDVSKWGGIGDIHAYSIGTVSCNLGDAPLAWEEPNPHHPVIPQNMYRIMNVNGSSRFEQLGQGWLKHGFCALQLDLCATCTPFCFGCCTALGPGCSDPYTSFRNGQQTGLGPRYEVNASTGTFPFPFTTYGVSGLVTYKRIQVNNNDLNPALNPGAQYYVEGQYVHPGDAAAGNQNNNASHRRVTVGTFTGGGYMLPTSGATVRETPAIVEWKTFDPAVTLTNIDVAGDGRFILGYRATDLGKGQWHYEFAIHNLNSHRSARAFSLPIPVGVNVTNIGFRDVDYHSQVATVGSSEQSLPTWARVDNVDWTPSIAGGWLSWSAPAYSGPAPAGNEQTVNALRFATTYNFRFDADQPPAAVDAQLGLFRPGSPGAMTVAVQGPAAPSKACFGDVDASGQVNGLDLGSLLGVWTGAASYAPCPPYLAQDLNQDCKVNGLDLGLMLGVWGPCP